MQKNSEENQIANLYFYIQYTLSIKINIAYTNLIYTV